VTTDDCEWGQYNSLINMDTKYFTDLLDEMVRGCEKRKVIMDQSV